MIVRTIAAVLMLTASAALVWLVFLSPDTPAPMGVKETPAFYEVRDWDQVNETPLNISLYTFRDRNRNGDYDTVDLPMAAVIVELTPSEQGGKVQQVTSNINGYANFKMRNGDPAHPISQANMDYKFSVLPPPGWKVTSGNSEQIIHFKKLAGSVAGLVAEKPPHWVGLAPDLTIKLAVVLDSGAAKPEDFSVQVISPSGESQTADAEVDGSITISAYPGNWKIIIQQAGTEWRYEQTLEVINAPVVLMPIILGSDIYPPLPQRVVEDFDWLNRSVLDKVANGHHGLNWDYLLAVDNQYYRGPGYVNGLQSGHAVAYNSSGHPVTISAIEGEKFDFVGGYFSVAWEQAHGEILEIAGWRNGEMVSRSALPLSYLGPVWLQADLRQIDKLTLSTQHYWQFVADDLRFRLQGPLVAE